MKNKYFNKFEYKFDLNYVTVAVANVRFPFPLLRASAMSRWPAPLKWTIVTGDGAAVRRMMRIREGVPSIGPYY